MSQDMRDNLSGIKLKGLVTVASTEMTNQRVVVQAGDTVWIKADTKLGKIDQRGVVVTVYRNQYLVVKAEGYSTGVTVKKSEVRLLPEVTDLVHVAKRVPTKYVSKKLFHKDFDDAINQYDGITRLTFRAGVDANYDPKYMFHPIWETSNFLDMLDKIHTYGEISLFGQNEQATVQAVSIFELIARQGMFDAKIPGPDQNWRLIFGDWDDNGVGILIPSGSRVRSLEDLGIHLVMNNESDKFKVRKYFRRVRAHHEWAISGSPIKTYAAAHGSVLTVQIDDPTIPFTFDVLHVDINTMTPENKALADGPQFISLALLKALGHKFGIDKLINAQVGDAFKGTMFSKLGLGKGFFHVVDMKRFGIIIYGPKTQVTFDGFFLGSLGDVKGGPARTDIQSFGAFITADTAMMWENAASLIVDEAHSAAHNEDALKHMVLTNMSPLGDRKNQDNEAWVFIKAIEAGVPLLKYPGLWRKAMSLLMSEVLDCENGRISYGDQAHRYDVMPDPNCFDFETGEVDYTQSVVPEDSVSCMDANEGPFAMYRQPLGNAKEAVITTNVHHRSLKKYEGRDRVIVGPSAHIQLGIMGGADLDDSVVGTDNIDWIQVIDGADYPVAKLPPAKLAVALPQETNRFMTRKRSYPTKWSMQVDFFDAMRDATKQQLSIGPIDNAVRLDTLLSGPHKAHMLNDLRERIDMSTGSVREDLVRAYTWLANRKDYQLRVIASNLDAFIDYIKLRKGDPTVLAPLVELIANIRDNSVVLPECWATLGSDRSERGRIPLARFINQDYVLAPSLICRTLSKITKERNDLQEAMRNDEWKNVDYIPQSLNVLYPRNKIYVDHAFALRSLWRTAFETSISGQTDMDRKKVYQIALNGGQIVLRDNTIVEITGIRQYLNDIDPMDADWEPSIRQALAVEIARQTYRSRHDGALLTASGTNRSFPDGLLWTNTIGLHYVGALTEAGLTGLYLPIKFDRYSRKLSKGTMEVRVYNGDVIKKSDGFQIGYVIGNITPPNGDYMVHDGILCVVEPALELTQWYDDINEDFDNPIDVTNPNVT